MAQQHAVDNTYPHQAADFVNVRAQPSADNFCTFFDRLVPCAAGKKVFTDRDKIVATVTEGGKVSVTDEAFAELCCINYWDKWLYSGKALWTDL